jgi:hypothetical protein
LPNPEQGWCGITSCDGMCNKFWDDGPCWKTANEVCSAIWMGRQEWISSSLFQRPDVFSFFARSCLYLQRKICVHERMHLFWAKSILHRPSEGGFTGWKFGQTCIPQCR